MSNIRIFEHKMFGEVRFVELNGKPYAVARDVATTLGYSNPNDAITRHCKGVVKFDTLTNGGVQTLNIIPEGDIYRLIVKAAEQSKNLEIKHKAEEFERWIFDEVLPSIRKHGAYMTEDVLERSIQDPDYMIGLLTALKEERQKRMEAEKTVNILMHVNKTYTATEIAKELGFKSAQQLNKDLERRRIQYQQNGTWVLFSKYADKGYVEIKQEVLDNGKVIYHRRFTQLGREFLLKLYGIDEGEVTA
ncbi:BRO family protein [Anoxybacteroides rupiense]|uniref:BRO family protein n=1 Tax=Anoxybacteroides rupiense TaxID=311460 RepID=UPI001F08CFDF|nr:BRO family protein [Anoxybacillus rupiensis]